MQRATASTHVFPAHLHDVWVLAVHLGGTGRLWHRRVCHTVGPETIVVLEPWEMHAAAPQDPAGWSYAALYPSDAIMRAAAAATGGRVGDRPRFERPLVHDPRLASRLARLLARLLASPASTLHSTHVLDVLGDLIDGHAAPLDTMPPSTPEHRAVRAARAYIETYYAQPIRLASLARQVNLSVFHLIRLFRRATGIPPCAYLEQVRVLRAQQLLLGGTALSEVAYATGFSDQSHFTRRFKRIFGVTPGQYVRDSRAGRPIELVEARTRGERRHALARRGA